MKKILVICGPTTTGKTDQAIRLAKKFNGELVSCDSRQVYIGLDIGTGKMPSIDISYQSSAIRIKKEKRYWEIDGVKIWMYDVADPDIQYSVYDYVKDAEKIIEDIIKRGKLPIIVGGTGLYLKGLLEGFPDMGIPVNEVLREELEKLTLPELQDRLKSVSIDRWNKLNNSDRQNPRRLLRSIEIILMNGYVDKVKSKKSKVKNYEILNIGLTAPREVLCKKVDLRVLSRIKEGMINETKELYEKGLSLERMRSLGLEYGCLADFLEGKIRDKEELIKILQGKIHAYVRRQLTWFRKTKEIEWFDVSDKTFVEKLEKKVIKWYDTK